MWWIPTFLVRTYHMTVGQAGELLGPMHLFAGTAATLLASWLVGRPAAADPRYITRLLTWVTALTTLPSVWMLWTDSFVVTRWLLWIFVPSVYFYIGPILGLLANVVPARMRATTVSLLLFAANFANLVIAPQLIGLISDAFQLLLHASKADALQWGLLLLAPTGFWAAGHLAAATRSIVADEAAASTGLARP